MKKRTLLILSVFCVGVFADQTSQIQLKYPATESQLVTSANINTLTDREFQYLLHKEKMTQDSIIATQTKELAVSEKPEGLYKATAIVSLILSALTTTFATLAFVSGSN